MSNKIKPIRRVVTGNDAQGRSCVLWDSDAPNVNLYEATTRSDATAAQNSSKVISNVLMKTHRTGSVPNSIRLKSRRLPTLDFPRSLRNGQHTERRHLLG